MIIGQSGTGRSGEVGPPTQVIDIGPEYGSFLGSWPASADFLSSTCRCVDYKHIG